MFRRSGPSPIARDPRPLGEPPVRWIVGIAAFGQAVRAPRAVGPHLQQHRSLVPPHAPHRRAWSQLALETARACHFGMRPASDDRPVLTVEFRERARVLRPFRPGGFRRFPAQLVEIGCSQFPVVGDDEPPLPGIAALGMPAGDGLHEEPSRFERPNVDFPDGALHVDHVDLARGLGEMPGYGGDPRRKPLRLVDGPHLPLVIDEVRPHDELARLAMDHASGMRAADAFRANGHLQPVVDVVELVRTAGTPMRRVCHEPQPAGPWDDGANATFAILRATDVVEDRQVRIDPADLQQRGYRVRRPGPLATPLFRSQGTASGGDANATSMVRRLISRRWTRTTPLSCHESLPIDEARSTASRQTARGVARPRS